MAGISNPLRFILTACCCLALGAVDRLDAGDILEPPPVKVDTAHDPLPFVPGSWTLVLLPDTQNYVDTNDKALLPGIFVQMCDWIVANKDARNIGLVLHEGDIVDNNDREHHGTPDFEWTLAKQAIRRLDGHVPYVLATGNHDYGADGSSDCRETALNRVFLASDNILNDPAHGGILAGVYERGRLDNTFSIIDTGRRKLLVFSLEFGPRRQVIQWANRIAAQPQFAGHTAVLLTHAYLGEGNLPDKTSPITESNLPAPFRDDYADTARGANPHHYKLASINPDTDPVHDGEELWDSLVSRHENFRFVFNGHYGSGNDTGNKYPPTDIDPRHDDGVATTARQVSTGIHGNPVHEIVANYQFADNGGNGFIRIMEFLPDGQTVRVKTYSPLLDSRGKTPWLTDPRHQFTLTLPSAADVAQTRPSVGVAALAIRGNEINADLPYAEVTRITDGFAFHIGATGGGAYDLVIDGGPAAPDRGVVLITGNTPVTPDGSRQSSAAMSMVPRGNAFNGGAWLAAREPATRRPKQVTNTDLSLAYFAFDRGWLGGHMDADGVLTASGNLPDGSVIRRVSRGIYQINPGGAISPDNGVLLVSCGQDKGPGRYTCIINADNGWTIRSRDNAGKQADGAFGFVYIPFDTPGMVCGRVGGNAEVLSPDPAGFSVTRLARGRYGVTIPGKSGADGVLLLSAAPNEADHRGRRLCYVYDDASGAFIVEAAVSGGTGTGLEDSGFYFSFIGFENAPD